MQWTIDNGQWTIDNGQWTMDNGQWTIDNGQWTMDNSADAHQLGGEMSFSLVSFPEKVVGRQARGTYVYISSIDSPLQEMR